MDYLERLSGKHPFRFSAATCACALEVEIENALATCLMVGDTNFLELKKFRMAS